MIDPITDLILEGNLDKLKEDALDHILEGYDLSCQQCGRVVSIVKDGQGPLSCCNQRMFVMGTNPVDPAEDIEEVRKTLKGQKVAPDFQVPVRSVNFSPDNQSEAQKKAEEDRIKQEKTPAFKESKLLQSLQVFDECEADFTPYNQPEVQKKTEEERAKRYKKPYNESSENIEEKGFETKPKGWTDKSVKKYGKSLVKGGGTKEGFFDKCVKKMKDKMDNPEGFCASIKDEAHDSTYWRGKGKSPQEVGKDVKKHKNV